MRRKNKGVNITFSLYPARRLPMLAPSRRQPLIPPSGHANRAPRISPGACPCWRYPVGKALIHRRVTPTGRLESRSPQAHVGATPPTTPCPTVGPRQQGAPNPTRRRPMLAPPRRQSLNPPSDHANRAPRIPPGAGPCWRRSAGEALIHRRVTPTGRPESRSAPAHVGAAPPTIPYPTVGPRQQGAPNPAQRLPMLAPSRRQILDPPSGHANRACPSSQRACPVPEGPLLAALPTLFESKFSREHGHKKRKISPLQQFQPKTKIISIKKSRTFRGKY